jgi:hypothetical protein
MKYPYFERKFNPNLDSVTIEIINIYWDWDMTKGSFVNTPTKIRMDIGITQSALNAIIKQNSETILFLGECVECNNPMKILVTSQSTAKSKIKYNNHQCSECRNNFNLANKGLDNYDSKKHRLDYALKFRCWTKLERDELSVLKKVVEFGNYSELYQKFIKPSFDFVWPILEKLDRLGLIDIQRSVINDGKVKTIYFLSELKNALKGEDRKNIVTESKLEINIPENYNREKSSQPHFLKKIVFDRNITIDEGIEYLCGVWKNSDGSIDFKLTPTDELRNKTSFQQSSEPKSIGEIISKSKYK